MLCRRGLGSQPGCAACATACPAAPACSPTLLASLLLLLSLCESCKATSHGRTVPHEHTPHPSTSPSLTADVTPEMQAWLAGAGWRWGAEQREGVLQGQGPAAAWAEREAAGCALLHLQLGFPLDLYSPCEYLQLYWYCDYLLDCQYRLGRILHAAAPPPPPRAAPSPKRGSAKPRGGRGGGQAAAAEAAGAAREVEVGRGGQLPRCFPMSLTHNGVALQLRPRLGAADCGWCNHPKGSSCSRLLLVPDLPCTTFPAASAVGDRAPPGAGHVSRRHRPPPAGPHPHTRHPLQRG
jgi:hypothetical protein